MKDFIFDLPTKIYFGENITENAILSAKDLLGDSVLIVTTGRSLIRNGYLDKLCDYIKKAVPNTKITVFDKISNNPDITEAIDAAIEGKKAAAKTVIGFGGGSAIDAAKAAAVGISDDNDLQELLTTGKEPSENTLPIIAIPTTAGTGTELSKAAIISSRDKGIKSGIRGSHLIPKVAIVDPYYTWTVPTGITMETGFDVLAHAIESYVSVKANAYSEMLSEEAIRIVGECLPRLYKIPDDHEARARMSYASMIMGINLKDVGTALPHRMQYPIGALTDTSHGAGLMALYPAWIKYEREYNEEKLNKVARMLSVNCSRSYDIIEGFNIYMNNIGGNKSLATLGVEKVTARELADKVTGNIANDPLSAREGIMEKIYSESM